MKDPRYLPPSGVRSPAAEEKRDELLAADPLMIHLLALPRTEEQALFKKAEWEALCEQVKALGKFEDMNWYYLDATYIAKYQALSRNSVWPLMAASGWAVAAAWLEDFLPDIEVGTLAEAWDNAKTIHSRVAQLGPLAVDTAAGLLPTWTGTIDELVAVVEDCVKSGAAQALTHPNLNPNPRALNYATYTGNLRTPICA